MGLDPLAVHHPGDGGDVKAGTLGDVLEHHGLQGGFVAVDEVVVLVLDNGPHRAFEGVLALPQGLDEPFGGIQLLLHEKGGILLGTVRGIAAGLQDLRILAVHAEFRDGETGHGQDQFAVFVVQAEVGNDLGGLVVIAVVDLAAGGGIELPDLFQNGLEFVRIQVEPVHQALEMTAFELIEPVPEHPDGIPDGIRLLLVFQLKQETFPQVAGSHTRRFELLHDLEHALHLLRIGFHTGPEGQVVHEGFDVAAQVTVVIQTADDEGGHGTLMVGEVPVAQLLHQALGKALLDGKGIVLRPFVRTPVLDGTVVIRSRVVIGIGSIGIFQGTAAVLAVLHLGDGHIAGFVRIAARGGRIVNDRIVVEHLAHMLLQGLHRHLDQLDGLDLERRKLLLKLLFKSLFDGCGHGTTGDN